MRRRGRTWRWIVGGVVVGILVLPLLALGVLRSDGVRAKIRTRAQDTLSQRLGPVEVGEHLSFDWQGRVTLGPILIPADVPGASPLVQIERVHVRPSLRALLSGEVLIASVLLEEIQVEVGEDGEGLKLLAERVAERRREPRQTSSATTTAPRRLPKVRFSDLVLRLPPDPEGAPREWKVDKGTLVVDAAPLRVRAEASLPGGGDLKVQLERGDETFTAKMTATRAPLRALFGPLADRLPVRVDGGVLTAELTVNAPGDLSHGSARWETALLETVLHNERLSSEPVGPLELHSDGGLTWSVPERRLTAEAMRIWLGPTPDTALNLKVELRLLGEPTFSLQLDAPVVDYRALVRALPPALSPGETVRDVFGTFAIAASAEGPLRRPGEWTLVGKVDPSKLSANITRSSALALGGEFVHQMSPSPENERTVRVGPGNPRFVPLDELPHVLVRAVLISEDVMFLRHGGFDFEGLQTGIASGAGEGQVLRGGSTITQQLAKNLFLSREKRYARKVREAFLTLALEAALSKQRLLEIYLNLIEWGPGLYGIGEAAAHYFGKDARELSVREAAFLATIIPNPVRYHVYCNRGALSEVWEQRVADLLAKLRNTGDITEEEYQEALGATLLFAHPTL